MTHENILVVVDMQVGFTTGSLANPAAVEIIPKIVKRINEYAGEVIYATRDTHYPDYLMTQEGRLLPVEHCIYGTYDWLIVPEIQEALNKAELRGIDVRYIDKPTFGYIDWKDEFMDNVAPTEVQGMDIITPLAQVYSGNFYDGDIVLVGTCTGICVISNATILKATCPEANIMVIADECACLNETTHKTALEAMKLMQIDII